MLSPLTDFRRNPSMASQSKAIFNGKPTVFGLYGVSGCGKSRLLKMLEQSLGHIYFAFYDESRTIGDLVPGGDSVFQSLEEQQQPRSRPRAIDAVAKECLETGKVGIVAATFMFWAEEQEHERAVYAQNDIATYAHILYLDTPEKAIATRRFNDTKRNRPFASAAHLSKWQHMEKIQLKSLCRQHGILFSSVSSDQTLQKVMKQLLEFRFGDEEHNLSCAKRRLDHIIASTQGHITTMVIIDADKTLTPQNMGALYGKTISESRALGEDNKTMKDLFDDSSEYSYIALRQAMLLYEEMGNDQEFDALCKESASLVPIHPEFLCLLQLVQEQEHTGAIVVTSGLRRVWDKVLARDGLPKVGVIGGGRIADGFVVTAHVKALLTARLRKSYHMCVWAFGDSSPDIEMLCEADRAIALVDEEPKRSTDMDKALINTTKFKGPGLRARQVLFPNKTVPRLNSRKLPIFKLTDPEFVKSLLGNKYTPTGLHVFCASVMNPGAAKLLVTPMRNKGIAGPDLRRAHRRIGHYMAIQHVSNIIGLESSLVDHVQGHPITGFQLFHEEQTTIVALMRGGEPMAWGVKEAFPLAMFVHASNPNDVKPHHLDGQLRVVLVKPVINTGKCVTEFVQHVRKLHATIQIIVIAGVIQSQCVVRRILEQALADQTRLYLIALYPSENKLSDRDISITDNRLFDTPDLP